MDASEARRTPSRSSPAFRNPKSSEIIARRIVDDQILGQPPGTPLPQEARMIEQYGVGRSTIREALRILEISGIVSLRAGRNGGPSIRQSAPEDLGRSVSLFLQAGGVTVGEVLAARQLLEPLLARDVAERADERMREQARELRARGRELDEMSDAQYDAVTHEFHEWLRSSSSHHVVGLFTRALGSMFRGRLNPQILPGRDRAKVLLEHERILDAILDGDAARAEEEMRRHMVDYVKDIARRQPEAFGHVVAWE